MNLAALAPDPNAVQPSSNWHVYALAGVVLIALFVALAAFAKRRRCGLRSWQSRTAGDTGRRGVAGTRGAAGTEGAPVARREDI